MEEPTKYLLVVGGPTASGKTGLAIALAQHFATEIISADSRQFYQEMKIGNARPTESELAAVPHHFIADRPLVDALSAGEFARQAEVVLEKLFQTHDHAVLVGGSGLFIKALTEGLDEFPEVSEEVRQHVRDFYEQKGLSALQAAVQEADPDYFTEVDQQNPVRLQRALEVCWAAGKPYSSFRKGKQAHGKFVPVYLQPVWPRDQLYVRINLRVTQMLAAGLEEEVRQLTDQQNFPALQTVGYQEWWPYFRGETTKDEVVQAIQQNSRRYAKRQMTWNRRDGYWRSIPQADWKVALAYLQLVKQEQLVLTSPSEADKRIVFHQKEEHKSIALSTISDVSIESSVKIILQKDWAFLQLQFGEESSYLSKVILLHEACYRAERKVVYTVGNDGVGGLLEAQGWEVADKSDLPKLLLELQEGNVWCWVNAINPDK